MQTNKKVIHLVCNAHLDPVWLWQWEDGLTEALSTFRTAVRFCEEEKQFVFNQGDALLYHWIEQHDPDLFKSIQTLVAQGQWRIIGGTWIQPDVNCPHGETAIRQYLVGLKYFRHKFDARPTTACNFDSFGHAEGFPQILAGCGMKSYIFCRPMPEICELPVGTFQWCDRSGISVFARRSDEHYFTRYDVANKLEQWVPHYSHEPETLILWGLGNHGGGPSEKELRDIAAYSKTHPDFAWRHSTPDAFFAALKPGTGELPQMAGEIQECFKGCYTSMSRVKRAYRETENLVLEAERLCTLAWWCLGSDYPVEELDAIWKDLLFSQFHDILPGSGVRAVEDDALQLLAHIRERSRRLRFTALIDSLRDEAPADGEQTPIFIVNPHGFRLQTQIEFEFITNYVVPQPGRIQIRRGGRSYPFQRLKEHHNIGFDWRVRVAVPVDLKPWEVLRLTGHFEPLETWEPRPHYPRPQENIQLKSSTLEICINRATGLVDHVVDPERNISFVRPGAFQPILFKDLDHSWTCGDPAQLEGADVFAQAPAWRKPSRRFHLATIQQLRELSPSPSDKWSNLRSGAPSLVRIVEDGLLQTVVEALFSCGPSFIARRYVFMRDPVGFEVHDRVFFNHCDHMLKLEVPFDFVPTRSISETPYSAIERSPTKAFEECTNQRWVAVQGANGKTIVAINHGTFGHSFTKKSLALNLLRSPAYASFNLRPDNPQHADRFEPRQDQGEHVFRHRFIFSHHFVEHEAVEAAAVANMEPIVQVYFPNKGFPAKATLRPPIEVQPSHVHIVAIKRSESGNKLVVRLHNLSSADTIAELRVAGLHDTIKMPISAFRLKSILISRVDDKLLIEDTSLVEGL